MLKGLEEFIMKGDTLTHIHTHTLTHTNTHTHTHTHTHREDVLIHGSQVQTLPSE